MTELITAPDISTAGGLVSSSVFPVTDATGAVLYQTSGADIAAAYGGTGGITSGTSFPVSPAAYDLFYRTDRGLIYFWDNVNSHWLTTELFISQLSGFNTSATLPITAGTLSCYGPMPYGAIYDTWVEEFCGSTIMTNGSVSSNYYTATLAPFGAVISTAADTQNVWTHHQTAINAVQAAGHWGLDCAFAKIGGGAVMYATFSLTYRLIG